MALFQEFAALALAFFVVDGDYAAGDVGKKWGGSRAVSILRIFLWQHGCILLPAVALLLTGLPLYLD